MKKKGITIDDLAGMVQGGFDEVRSETKKGFEAVDRRFEVLTGEMNKRFDDVNSDINSRFNFVGSRLDVIETELMDIRKKMDNIVYRHEFEYLKERVEKLEARLVGTKKK